MLSDAPEEFFQFSCFQGKTKPMNMMEDYFIVSMTYSLQIFSHALGVGANVQFIV